MEKGIGNREEGMGKNRKGPGHGDTGTRGGRSLSVPALGDIDTMAVIVEKSQNAEHRTQNKIKP
jgi:hypothetical protein